MNPGNQNNPPLSLTEKISLAIGSIIFHVEGFPVGATRPAKHHKDQKPPNETPVTRTVAL